MWLSDVTVITDRAFVKSVTLEVTVGKCTTVKATFNGDATVYTHKMVPTMKFTQGTQVKVQVRVIERNVLRKIFPNVVVQGTFSDPTTTFLHDDRRGYKIMLNVVADQEPLRDLMSTSTEFTSQLETVLDRLGRGKQVLESGVTVATAVGEFNHVLKAVVALVAVAHQHLREQEKRDKGVKTLADCIQYIFEQINDVKESSGAGTRLVSVISRGEELLRDCVDFIIQYCSIPAAARAFRASVQSKDKDRLEDLQLRLDTFRDEFDRQLLVHIVKALPGLPNTLADTSIFPPAMPPKPARMLGRNVEEAAVTSTILSSSPRLIVLGDGGMGKTTLALWAMYGEEVIARYNSRLFVSCEGITSLSLLINKVADVLRIPSTGRNTQLYDIVLRALREHPCLLCLDNFETPWEDNTSRVEVEGFLRHLHAVPNLALIVTMRGTERPALELPWSQALSPLTPLCLDDAIAIFEDIVRKPADACAKELIAVVACVPLAVTLVAALARDQSAASLLEDWQSRGTEMVETSGMDRGSNLGVSISVSVNSVRMRQNPLSKDVLALLALLPDGLSTTMLNAFLPYAVGMDIHKALSTLQHIALVQKEDANGVYCYVMLPPVRRWCIAKLPAPVLLKNALYQTYVTFLQQHRDRTIANHHFAVKKELINSERILLEAFEDDFQHPLLCEAVVSHSHWSMYVGYVSDIVLRVAVAHTDGSTKANYLRQLAYVHWRRAETAEMERALTLALQLYERTDDIPGKADALQLLGRLYIKLHRLDESKGAFKSAMKLHEQARDDLGRADDLHLLGVVLARDRCFDEALEALMSALELHELVRDDVGKGRDLQALGNLYFVFDRIDEAVGPLTMALEVHKQAHNGVGEADIFGQLGRLYMRQDRFDDAEQSLMLALERYRQWRSVGGEAYGARYLGDLLTRRGQFVEAEQTLKLALELDKPGRLRAVTLRLLGVLYTRWNRLDEAEMNLKLALEMCRQAMDIHLEAEVLRALGELDIRLGCFQSEERSIRPALEIYERIHDKEGLGNTFRILGQTYTHQDKFDEADEAIQAALTIHRDTKDRYWERIDLEALAELDARRAEVEAIQQEAPVIKLLNE